MCPLCITLLFKLNIIISDGFLCYSNYIYLFLKWGIDIFTPFIKSVVFIMGCT